MTEDAPTLAFVLGTRPEIIKLAPVIRACERRGLSYSLIHTGQHYAERLDDVFFEQLDLPAPDYDLAIGSGSHGEQTGAMIADIESVLRDERPDVVLVQGDTNSVLAGAIATSKLDAELGHVEAGLRSFDRDMPEETNRVLADHAADYLFAPTDEAARQLDEEGLPGERVVVTGNTIVDAVRQHERLAADTSTVLSELDLDPNEFALLTAHRAENVDEKARFADLLDGVADWATGADMEVIYPIHPRAEARLEAFELSVPSPIRTIPPQDFLDFLCLEANAALVLTDSGGVQEETCILETPCVTLRDSTERPETLDVGSNTLVGIDPDAIVTGATTMQAREPDWSNPFGDGHAADRILDALCDDNGTTERPSPSTEVPEHHG